MSNTLKQLINTYENLKSLVDQNSNLEQQEFNKLRIIFEDKISNPDLRVMVYGVYNAGKSTLINAMAGEEVAEVGDVPVTDTVAEYTCGSYKVLDTPGIDAPLEHEEITIKEILKADAIIFVVNPIGVVEEQKTLEAMLKLLAEGKKVFLVFNEKHALSDEDYFILKEQTYQKIQELAPKYDLYQVLQDIPICKINAKAALTARLQKSEGFLKSTGYIDFESILQEFLDSITNIEINSRLTAQLLSYLNENVKSLELKTNNKIVNSYDNLIKDIKSNRFNLRKETKNHIEGKQRDFSQQIKNWLYNEQKDVSTSVKHEIQQYCQILGTELKDNLDIQASIIQTDIAELQARLPDFKVELNFDQIFIDDSLIVKNEKDVEDVKFNNKSSQDFNSIQMAAKALQNNIEIEHVVEGLNVAKAFLPKLMKDMSEEAIEQLAKKTVAKYIPYIGTAVTVALSLRDIFGTDDETKQLIQQQEVEQRARERWEQQIEDVSKEVSRKFANDVTTTFYKLIDDFFNSVIAELKTLQNEFSYIDKNNSMLLEKLYDIQKSVSSKVV